MMAGRSWAVAAVAMAEIARRVAEIFRSVIEKHDSPARGRESIGERWRKGSSVCWDA